MKDRSELNITDCTFARNYVLLQAAALMIESQSKVDIDTTDFFGLTSRLTASAISVNDGQDKSVTIKTSSFVNNTSG